MAATFAVPGDYDTISEALDVAGDGDTIEVAAGIYNEAVVIQRDVALVGVDGAASTLLSASSGVHLIDVAGAAVVTVEGFTVSNPSTDTGAIRVAGAATLTLSGVTVEATPATHDGAGVLVEEASTLIVNDSVFDGNTTVVHGGHIAVVDESVFTATNTAFTRGVGKRGAAVRAVGATVSLSGCTFSDNHTTAKGGKGGAIQARSTTLTVDDSSFSNNSSTGAAGHISGTLGAQITITDSTLSGGVAVAHGGSVSIKDSILTLSNVHFVDGTTSDAGGHIYVSSGALSAESSSFSGGVAASEGGAVHAQINPEGGPATLVLDRCTFDGNTALLGGAISITESPSTLSLSQSYLVSNSAESGGAVYAEDVAEVAGTGNLLCGNASTGAGGAVWSKDVSDSHVWANNLFVENAAATGGGAALIEGGTANFTNNSFLSNAAGSGTPGGSLRLDGVDITLINNLIAWTGAGDGVHATWTGAPAFGAPYDAWFANADFDVSGGVGAGDLGVGTVYGDPLLTSYTANGDCLDDDFAPALGSPLIDAGDPGIDDLDGSRSDIGALGGPGGDLGSFDPGDEDGDGFPAPFDCDDANPAVHPGADEVCDGGETDEDCDDLVDDDDPDVTGTTSWYVDVDGDGWGDGASVIEACVAPADSGPDGDCNDADPAIHPDATEVCDDASVDENCDGVANGPGAIGSSTWYDDADGDGFGDVLDLGVNSCGLPGHVANSDDCDDSDPTIHPGAEDTPGDGVDQDCQGIDPVEEYGTEVCGCASTAPHAGWAWALVVLGVVRRRPTRAARSRRGGRSGRSSTRRGDR